VKKNRPELALVQIICQLLCKALSMAIMIRIGSVLHNLLRTNTKTAMSVHSNDSIPVIVHWATCVSVTAQQFACTLRFS
jgi:hypothetical protein